MNARRYPAALLFFSAALATLPATAVLAADGALEISQACVATGCFPGDSPGFPVEILESGSYVLTSNLQVPDENTTAILLHDGLTLDLGGFTISGITVCGAPSGGPCTPIGSGEGISTALSGGLSVITVSNGSVRGMGGSGISLGARSLVENVHTSSNGLDGISVGHGIVRNCISVLNGGSGITTNGGVVTGNSALFNHSHGIIAVDTTVRGNAANGNGELGIRLAGSSVAIENTMSGNEDAGLSAFAVPGAPSVGYAGNSLANNADGTAANQVSGPLTPLGLNLCAGVPCP